VSLAMVQVNTSSARDLLSFFNLIMFYSLLTSPLPVYGRTCQLPQTLKGMSLSIGLSNHTLSERRAHQE
jgi:hypothetical protein